MGMDKKVNVGIVTMWFVRGIGIIAKSIVDILETNGMETHIFSRWESHRQHNKGDMDHPSIFYAGDDPEPQALIDWIAEKKIDVLLFAEYHERDIKRAKAAKEIKIPMLCLEMMDILQVKMIPEYEIFDSMLSVNDYGYNFWNKAYPQKNNLKINILKKPTMKSEDVKAAHEPLMFMHNAGWGGVNFRKNTDTVIQVFNEVVDDGSAFLRVYSQLPFNEYPGDLAGIIKNDKNITFYEGTISPPDTMYKNMDVYLGPSKFEGYGLPHEESLRNGLALICSLAPVQSEWVDMNGFAIYCDIVERNGMVMPQAIIDKEFLTAGITDCINSSQMVTKMKVKSVENYSKKYHDESKIWLINLINTMAGR